MSGLSKLIRWNKIEAFLGAVAAAVAIFSAVGAWWILPYRVQATEKRVVELSAELDALQAQANANRELLVRIDERLQAVQRALRISDNK